MFDNNKIISKNLYFYRKKTNGIININTLQVLFKFPKLVSATRNDKRAGGYTFMYSITRQAGRHSSLNPDEGLADLLICV